MKKMFMMVVVTMIMVLGFITPVKAETISQKMLEMRVRHEVADYEESISDGIMEEEALLKAIEFSVDYEDLGNGIYDICIKFVIYTKYEYEYHFTYDAYDDYELADYGVKDGKRLSTKELNKYLEEKFPELFV